MSKTSNLQKIEVLKVFIKGLPKIRKKKAEDSEEFLQDKYVNELGDKFNPNYVNPNYKGKNFNPNFKPNKN